MTMILRPPPAGNASLPCYAGVETAFECGGQYAGYCDHATGSCVCINGWSGRSELTFTMDLSQYGGRVLDCPVHLPAFRVIYGTTLFVCVVLFVFHLAWVLPKTMKSYEKHRRNTVERGRKPWWSFTPLRIELLLLAVFASVAALAAVKVADPEWDSTLLGIHPLPSLLDFLIYTIINQIGYVDFNGRRNILLKKRLFLRGEKNSTISQRLRRARWKFKIITAMTLAPAIAIYLGLPQIPPSGNDATLPFSHGRFILFPGCQYLEILMFLVYRHALKQDLDMINELFRKLTAMTSMTATSSFFAAAAEGENVQNREEMNDDTREAVTKIEQARKKLENYYFEVRRTFLTVAIAQTILTAVPPLWTKMSWWKPFQFMLFVPASLKLSAHYTPGAYPRYGKPKDKENTSRSPSSRLFRRTRSSGVTVSTDVASTDDEQKADSVL